MLHLRRPVGAIVGRTDEIRSLATELDRARLLSLIGPGGVGKTALAAELAHEVEPDFERTVAVELADAERPQDPLRLLSTAVLGAPSSDLGAVAASLESGPSLVLIDNCEHLVDAVAELVDRLLAATSGLTVLTTSRRPLGLGPETLWTVDPLPVPIGDDEDDLVEAPAVQLFLERVYQAVPTFELTGTNRTQVAEICRAADGVPLVLELAAALVRTTTLDEVLREMSGATEGLASSRRDLPHHQRSIEASLDWSRRFLDPGDRQLLDRLSVFVGGFTAEAAAAVEPQATRPALTRLCDHSLVSFDPSSGRYRILEVLRLDAAARLEPARAAELGDRHTAWCQTVVTAIDEARYDADPDHRFPRFEAELPNLCAAARRCIDRSELDRFRALLGPIAVWWVHYLPPDDPEEWAGLFDTDDAPLLWRANVISALAFLASHHGDHPRALELAEEAVDLLERAGDRVGAALAATAVGNARLALGDRAGAEAAYRAGLATARACGHPYPEMVHRVSLVRLDPEADEVDDHLARAADLARGGFGAIEAVIWTEQGLRALRQGDRARAVDRCDRAIERARVAGYPESLASALCGRGEVAVADGDRHLADRLYREALRIGRQASHQGVIVQAEAGLDGLTGLDRRATGRGGPAVDGAVEALSERELAVARLLRGDLTQREIADELYIAPSTVKTHITSIYRKLGVAKRSHAITRAAELGLF